MEFFAEKENGEENHEDATSSDQIIHPVAPPTTVEFEENIGGLKNTARVNYSCASLLQRKTTPTHCARVDFAHE